MFRNFFKTLNSDISNCSSFFSHHVQCLRSRGKNFNSKQAPERYIELACNLGFNGNDEEKINQLINKIFELNQTFKIPHSLKEYGVQYDEIMDNEAELKDKALADGCTSNNPRKIQDDDIMLLLKNIYEGNDMEINNTFHYPPELMSLLGDTITTNCVHEVCRF